MSDDTDPGSLVAGGVLVGLFGIAFAGLGVEQTGWVTEAQLHYYSGVLFTVIGVILGITAGWLFGKAVYYKVIADA